MRFSSAQSNKKSDQSAVVLFTAWHTLSAASSSLDTLSQPSFCKSTTVRCIPKATEGIVTAISKGVRKEKRWRTMIGKHCEVKDTKVAERKAVHAFPC